MEIKMDSKTYRVEQTDKGVRVGVVVVNTVTAQHPYIRWLPADGPRAAKVIEAANTAR